MPTSKTTRNTNTWSSSPSTRNGRKPRSRRASARTTASSTRSPTCCARSDTTNASTSSKASPTRAKADSADSTHGDHHRVVDKEAYVHTQGTVAVVTGGASGLGRASAIALAEAGAAVVVADLPTSNGPQL